MKKLAYIIGNISIILAIFIIELLLGIPLLFTMFSIVFSIMIGYLLSHSTSSITKPFERYDIEGIKRIINQPSLLSMQAYDSKRLYEAMLKISIGEYGKLTKDYINFGYLNDLDQYKESYIFQYLFLMKNDIEEFLTLKKEYNIIKNKVIEDNIQVMVKPGTILNNRVKYFINLELLDDVYNLYNNPTLFDELSTKVYEHNVYNYMLEKALYHYLTNTEQLQRRHAFWLDSDYIFDEFLDIEQPEE